MTSGESSLASNISMGTFVEVVKNRHIKHADQLAYMFVSESFNEDSITYAQLYQRAEGLAAVLQHNQLVGKPVVLSLPSGIDFIVSLFACLMAGAIAVPAYPPRKNKFSQRFFSIIKQSNAKFILSNTQIINRVETADIDQQELEGIKWLNCTESMSNPDLFPDYSADKVAILQYTSGSTSLPKGVTITFGNLLANASMIAQSLQLSPESKALTWLPLFHDMGLIAHIIVPYIVGCPSYLMSPTTFIKYPDRWLKAITKYKITYSGGPNFMLDACVKRYLSSPFEGVDLSSLTVLFVSAEPIQYKSMKQFAETFIPFGFNEKVFLSGYGLAEATLIVSGSAEQFPTYMSIDANQLSLNKIALAVADTKKRKILVGCGPINWGDQQVRIVDPESLLQCPANQVGEICLAGKHVTKGYWNQPEVTTKAFIEIASQDGASRLFRTGDLGFIDDHGELFVTGRIKEMMVIRGENHYPYDIEKCIEQVSEYILDNHCIVCSVEIDGEEKPIAVAEVSRQYRKLVKNNEMLLRNIMKAVSNQFGISLHEIVLVSPLKLPKTTSGKLARVKCARFYLESKLDVLLSSKELLTQQVGPIDTQGAPKNLAEFVLGEIANITGISVSSIKLNDSVNSLGLDSLTISQLSAKLEEHFSISISMDLFIDDRTLAELIAAIEDLQNDCRKTAPKTEDHPLRLLSSGPIAEIMAKMPMRFLTIDRQNGRELIIQGREFIDFASCNYLGMDLDKNVMESILPMVKDWGIHPSWTRAVASPKPYIELEQELADFVGATDVVVFPNLALTSIAALSSLTEENSVIFLCQSAHNTIREAAELAKSRGRIVCEFKYMDFNDLEKKMALYPDAPKLIAVDGVYSMTAEFINLPELLKISRRYHAQIYVDDAHGFGVIGENSGANHPYGFKGNGIAKYFNVELAANNIIYAAGLSKAFSSHAAFITCHDHAMKRRLQLSSPYIFSGPVPVSTLASSLKGLEINQYCGDERRNTIYNLTAELVTKAKQMGFEVDNNHGFPAVFIVIGDLTQSLKAINHCWDRGILLTPGLFPATPLNRCGLRLSITANHSHKHILHLLAVLEEIRCFQTPEASNELLAATAD